VLSLGAQDGQQIACEPARRGSGHGGDDILTLEQPPKR
jgi:hypothetical protein